MTMIQTKFQIDKDAYEFIKQFHKKLHYKSLSEYMREAVTSKVCTDRKTLREMKRVTAMEMIGEVQYENLFETLEGENFEDC